MIISNTVGISYCNSYTIIVRFIYRFNLIRIKITYLTRIETYY